MAEAPRRAQPRADLELRERIREVFRHEADNVAEFLASPQASQLPDEAARYGARPASRWTA